MKSGKLRHTITVQTFTNTVDDFGGAVKQWTDRGALRAEVIQQSTEEFMRGLAVDETGIIFRTRALSVVTAERVLFEGNLFDVKEIVPAANGRWMELRCVRVS